MVVRAVVHVSVRQLRPLRSADCGCTALGCARARAVAGERGVVACVGRLSRRHGVTHTRGVAHSSVAKRHTTLLLLRAILPEPVARCLVGGGGACAHLHSCSCARLRALVCV